MVMTEDKIEYRTLTSVKNNKCLEEMLSRLELKSIKELVKLLKIDASTLHTYTRAGCEKGLPKWFVSQCELLIKCPEALVWAKTNRLGFSPGKVTLKDRRPVKNPRKMRDL
jgi:hypothetical protein